MSTYREKIEKYEARVKKAIEIGLEPLEEDLDKLYYFVGRAEKKGPEHKTKLKDKARSVGEKLPGLLKEAGKAVLN